VATGGDGQTVLTWGAVAGDGTPVTGYALESSEDQSTWTFVGATDRDTLTLTDLGMTPGTLTYYRVAATSGLGDAAWSNTASDTATLTIVAESGASAHWFLPEQTTDLISAQTLTITGSQDGVTNIITLDLNGTDNVITGRADATNITIACVIKLDTASTDFVQLMGSLESNGVGGERGMGVYRKGAATGAFRGRYNDGASERADDAIVTREAWTFLSMSITSAGVMTIHRTGGNATATKFQTGSRGTLGTGGIALGSGALTQPPGTTYTNGFQIAEIIVWEGTALSSTQLQDVGSRSIARAASAGLTIAAS
jgi:hypothetical protein